MKSVVAAVITCMILFGVSFAASKYYMDMEASEPDEAVVAKEETVDQSSTLPPHESEIGKVDQMPVAHRPENSMSLEAVLQMSDSVKQMEENLRLREMRLAKEEQRVKLLFVDIETEQDQLQAFSEGIDAKVAALSEMTAELRQLLATLDTKKAELATMEKDVGVDEESKLEELDNKINFVKSWFENLESQQAADYLKEFANNGKLDFAAGLLHKMPTRQKSKILAELADPVLVEQLVTALRVPPKAK
ncbi:hypothetical protein [Mariniblastus fucicola]|uniref:Magnesium transporter MgtE intracellular domain-containing protein n=1 Tax=Mariniblastus fucicola TaxID=980251 RepID=A0A5B9P9F0_9BACT|nr:hypothetical protein [Mariniblastus fucicola]QEG23367.1 hypothetical protein MFFC18_32650 [Mariniblastus fucicola]